MPIPISGLLEVYERPYRSKNWLQVQFTRNGIPHALVECYCCSAYWWGCQEYAEQTPSSMVSYGTWGWIKLKLYLVRPQDNNRIVWKFTELSQHSDNHGVGSILARFDMENGPSNPSTISTAFNCEGTTLSGIDFQLVGPGYRLSLVKRRFVSGKYICDGDQKYSSGTGTPSTGSAAASTVSSVGDPNC